MKKHFSITSILEELNKKTQFYLVEIVDNWEGDLCAIGLKKDDKLVYISTYSYIDEREMLLDYDFELIQKQKETPLNVQKKVRGSNFQLFIEDLKGFLEI